MPIGRVKCPKCLEKGFTVWVIAGKCCPRSRYACRRNAFILRLLLSSLVLLRFLGASDLVGLNNFCENYSEALFYF